MEWSCGLLLSVRNLNARYFLPLRCRIHFGAVKHPFIGPCDFCRCLTWSCMRSSIPTRSCRTRNILSNFSRKMAAALYSSSLKKLDNRIRMLLEDGVRCHHRTIFVIVGDKAKDQVPLMYHMLGHATKRAQPSVLWCYKKELGFSSHRKKRMREVQKKLRAGNFHAVNDSSYFDKFVASTSIRYCYYSESHKILGQTFDMCVLQDFEAITPNLLARTIETVAGGGMIVFLIKSLQSLRQLATMVMDVHARLRTEAHAEVVPRFNERFLLSLANNPRCLAVTDRFDVLPLSTNTLNMQARLDAQPRGAPPPETQEAAAQLETIKQELRESQPIGSLVALCKTADQARALMHLAEVMTEATLSSTVALTAARGRGKSAVLGLATANAVVHGYSNVFITSPAPENVKTLFEFVVKGLQACGYEEHMHFAIVERKSTQPHTSGHQQDGSGERIVTRLNIFRSNHRQTVQYIDPREHAKLSQAELVVVDEAAAIPLPIVKQLIGPYVVFLSSTVNGYEGTGRSLSLKLIDELRRQSALSNSVKQNSDAESTSSDGRKLREIELKQPVRYGEADSVEAWLHELLCLNVNAAQYTEGTMSAGCPPAADCELYYVNKDALFSYHKASEQFLHRIMSLMVASHYKNTPDDLQIIADAPAHHVFVLLPPVASDQSGVPEVLCVVQVALEGEISRPTVLNELARGRRSAGDLIPWTVAQQFQDENFPQLSGARVVRVAVHPAYQSMGYGSRALQLLRQYYEGMLPNTSGSPRVDFAASNDAETNSGKNAGTDELAENDNAENLLTTEKLMPRTSLPPLLQRLRERHNETLQWMGVSYGITPQLLKFWKRNQYVPVYIRQTTNDITGEHTCIMLRMLNQSVISPNKHNSTNGPSMRSLADTAGWLREYYVDFRRRFLSLLGGEFRDFAPAFALNLLNDNSVVREQDICMQNALSADKLLNGVFFSKYDLRRLGLYANNMTDYHVVMDLLPTLARLKFCGQLGPQVHMSALQDMILIGVGLQYRTVDALAAQLNVPSAQLMGMFNKTVRKLYTVLNALQKEAMEHTLSFAPAAVESTGNAGTMTTPVLGEPLRESLDAELNAGARRIQQELSDASRRARKAMQRDSKQLLEQYSIKVSETELTGGTLSTQKPIKGFVSGKRRPAALAVPDTGDDVVEQIGSLQAPQPDVFSGARLPAATRDEAGDAKKTGGKNVKNKSSKNGAIGKKRFNNKSGGKTFGSGNKMFSKKR